VLIPPAFSPRTESREEGLTPNWFRAIFLDEGDLERLNPYLLPLLGTDGRGGLTDREILRGISIAASIGHQPDRHCAAGVAEPRVHRGAAVGGYA
jgi:hypothetical protein